MKSKKTKHLKKGELRVLQVRQDAIYELLRETLMERANTIFDILDVTKIGFQFYWDNATNQFICAVHDGAYSPDLDLDALGKEVGVTTDTFYTMRQQYQTVYMTGEDIKKWRKLPE